MSDLSNYAGFNRKSLEAALAGLNSKRAALDARIAALKDLEEDTSVAEAELERVNREIAEAQEQLKTAAE